MIVNEAQVYRHTVTHTHMCKAKVFFLVLLNGHNNKYIYQVIGCVYNVTAMAVKTELSEKKVSLKRN